MCVTNGAPMTVAALVLVMSLAFVGCDSEAQRIRDGDCINSTLPEGISIATVVIVPCAETWQYRVLNSFDVADADQYPGENFFQQRANESCDRRYSYFLTPPAESWGFGDRTVKCLQVQQ